MKNKLFYILGITSVVLSSCQDDDMADMFLNGKEKTPLPVTVALSTEGVQTRAVDKNFMTEDELLVYIEHIDGSNSSSVDADMAPALVKFRVTSDDMSSVEGHPNTLQTSNLKLLSIQNKGTGDNLKLTDQETLYWDDFSDSRSADKDLRTESHGIRPLYGYCYNGGAPSAELNPTAGTLGWTVATNQTTSGIKTNDLLWSGTPETYVSYNHNNPASVGLRIPYTHAMSKITIVLVAGKGFKAEDLATSAIDLKSMNTVCTVNAASSSLGKAQITNYAADGTIKDVKMYKHPDNGSLTVDEIPKPTCTFEAIVVPNKQWAKGNAIATITGMDGNTYNIVATESIISQFLHNTTNSYAQDETVTLEPGKNYKLTITVDKQPQNIVAEITDWDNVTATGVGTIQFAADVVSHNMETENVLGSFDLWRSTDATDHNSFDEDKDSSNGVTEATKVTYEGGSWKNSPEIYWANGSQEYYFRALAKFVQVEDQKQIISTDGVAPFNVAQGTDIVWGTTSAHRGTYSGGTRDYDEGAKINPRTGTVPMTFYHAMSKISVNLATSSGADAVNLAGAKISIANLYDGGTIDLTDGSIKSLTASTPLPIARYLADGASGEGNKLSQYVVVPQSLNKMADGTTDRTGAVSFYNQAELTKIGEQWYVTSTLDPVYYTEQEVNEYNITLPGAKHHGDVKEHYDTQEKVDAKNATLPGAVQANNPLIYTAEQFTALTNAEISEDLFNKLLKSQYGFGYDEYVSTIPSFKPFSTYGSEAYGEDLNTLLTAIGHDCKHNERSANAYNAKLEGAVSLHTMIEYSEEEINAYNASLLGARSTTDVKEYNPKDGDASLKANPGDLKTNEANPVIKMLIMLEDGTTYTLNLSDCKDSNRDLVKVWQRGKHYTYNISLKKEEITFRAMVKDWDPSTGSGNATLDWD